MKFSGFTLIELLIVIVILAIIIASAAPSFTQSIQDSRTKTAQYELLGAIEHARSLAVFNGSRSVLKAKNEWHDGWEIFLDKNDDGIAGANEPILLDHPPLPGVTITGNGPVEAFISFISTGEARSPGRANAGAFVTGTLTLCPATKGKGYKLVLSRGGRMRSEATAARDCNPGN
jgi:type IV fimbrial biogenesis protein FimT